MIKVNLTVPTQRSPIRRRLLSTTRTHSLAAEPGMVMSVLTIRWLSYEMELDGVGTLCCGA